MKLNSRLLLAFFAVALTPLQAADFTWDGGIGNWGDTNWNSGAATGPTAAADTATISSGTVNFTQHDTFGVAATLDSPAITLNAGGTLSNGTGNWFNTIWNLNMNGGSLYANGGHGTWGAFALGGTVTVAGSSASTISGNGTGNARIDLRNEGTTFDVSDVTGDAGADLTISAVVANASGSWNAGSLVKTGAGTLSLTAANTFTGSMIGSGGILDVASGGSVNTSPVINTKNGGALTISGVVTVANNGSFGVGAGVTGTTGSVTVNTGGELNIGGGGGFTGIGGRDLSGTGLGNGTLTIAGGTLNVAAPSDTPSNGLDAKKFWMNPYGSGGGTSTINLDGGVLSTQREIRRGSVGNTIFNFNGGTLQAAAGAASAGSLLFNMTRTNVRDGGGTIDTQAFDITHSQSLLHSNIGGDNAIDGGLTKTGSGTLTLGGANTFTGDLVINEGTLKATNNVNNPNPTATALGNMTTAGRQIVVNSAATLEFAVNNPMGNATATPLANLSLVVDGGTATRTSGTFTALPNVTLKDGAILTGGNGVNASYQSYTLLGSVTASGTSGSSISTTGSTNTGVHLAANTAFDVGATSPLSVSAPLIDRAGGAGAGALTKTGAGEITLSATSTYTGTTTVSAGTLFVSGALGLTDTTVASGAAIGGGGLIGGSLIFDSGADFVFSSTDTLTVDGASVSFGGFDITNLFGLDSSVDAGTYTLIDGSASFDFTNVSNFGLANAAGIGGGKSAYFEAGSLNVVVIPEPGVAILGGLGLLGLMLRRRR